MFVTLVAEQCKCITWIFIISTKNSTQFYERYEKRSWSYPCLFSFCQRKGILLSEVVFFQPYTFSVSVCEAFMLMELYGCRRAAPKVRLYSRRESEQRGADQRCFAEYLVTIKTAENKMAFWWEQKRLNKNCDSFFSLFLETITLHIQVWDRMVYGVGACADIIEDSVCDGNAADYSF